MLEKTIVSLWSGGVVAIIFVIAEYRYVVGLAFSDKGEYSMLLTVVLIPSLVCMRQFYKWTISEARKVDVRRAWVDRQINSETSGIFENEKAPPERESQPTSKINNE